jgi:E3 ubiquitin-protein ligase RFWD3
MNSSRLNGEESDTHEEDNFDEDDDDIEFKKSKMPRLDTDDASNATATTSDSSKSTCAQEESELCPICFESWTNAGAHRLVCLKCGHLFGEMCIDRWIKSNPKCPQCNRPSKRTDIRRIYAKTIKVIDTAELDKALKDLEGERTLRKKAEISTSEMKIQYQVLLEDYNRMKDEYQRYKLQNLNQNNLRMNSTQILNNDRLNSLTVYGLDKTINITDLGGCRVTAFSSRCVALLVSQPSNSALFPGFGIKKINFLDYKLNQYIPIHSKTIRDLAINSSNDDGIILTCGLDKTIKLTNIVNNVIIHSYECPAPVWSCTFNTDNPLYFYAGLQNGKVLTFDKRKTDKYIDILNNDIACCQPISSLQYISSESALKQSGLLVTHLDRTVFYGTNNFEQYNYYPLLIENNMTCSSYDPQSGLLLVSMRPTEKHPSVRHLAYEFSVNKNEESTDYTSQVSLNLLNNFIGAPKSTQFLSKSKIFQYNNEIYACAPDPSNSALIWNVRKNETIAKLQNTNEVLDLCPIYFNNTHYISTLTEKQLRVFKRNID